MNIYLACTVRGDRGSAAAVRRISDRIYAHGHRILTTHLLADNVEEAERALTNQQVFLRDLDWLDRCDAVVAEASGSSYGVGFEVGYVIGQAAQSGKRVYVLYDAAREGAISRLITGLVSPHAHVLGYRSLDEIDPFLSTHLG
jgi:nucleoside 2-deoxyribosyltransferase